MTILVHSLGEQWGFSLVKPDKDALFVKSDSRESAIRSARKWASFLGFPVTLPN